MARNDSTKPTAAELGILKILWRDGPSTVRQVHEALESKRRTGYTTTLKQLQVMAEKGLVRRDENRRSHVYEACFSESRTLRQLTEEVLDRVFDGSAQKLVLHALQAKGATAEEMAEIRALLDSWERGEGHERD